MTPAKYKVLRCGVWFVASPSGCLELTERGR